MYADGNSNREDVKELLKQAEGVVELFENHPGLGQLFSNVFQKAKEVTSFGLANLLRCASTYCIPALTILFAAFRLAYENYNRAEECIHHIKSHSEDILRWLKNFHDSRIKPMLKAIDEQLKTKTEWTVKMRKSLKSRLKETKDILREIQNVLTQAHIELVGQRRKNHVSLAGIALGVAGMFYLPRREEKAIAFVTAVASGIWYCWGTDNTKLLYEAIENLLKGREQANNLERELLKYDTNLELDEMGK